MASVAEPEKSTLSNLSPVAGMRLVGALLVVPFVAGMLMFITYLALWSGGAHVFEGPVSDLAGAADVAVGLGLGVTMIGFVVTGMATLAVVWMASRGPLSLRTILALGAVLGNVPFALIVVSILVTQLIDGTLSTDVGRFWYGLYGAVRSIALGLWIGTVSAAVFWAIGVGGQNRTA